MTRPSDASIAKAFWRWCELVRPAAMEEAAAAKAASSAREYIIDTAEWLDASPVTQASIQAPTGEPPRDWTDDQRREAQAAMAEIREMRERDMARNIRAEEEITEATEENRRQIQKMSEPDTTFCPKCTGSIPTGKHCAGAECPLRSQA